jgi:hypothetical protein
MGERGLERRADGDYLGGRRLDHDAEIEVWLNSVWTKGRYSFGEDVPMLRPLAGRFKNVPLPIIPGAPCRWPR